MAPIWLEMPGDDRRADFVGMSLIANSTRTGRRFLALDACRGLLAVLVVLFHADEITHWRSWSVVRNGSVAVDFFFVLSGFVITSAYGTKLKTILDLRSYAVRRFGRLYPLHLSVLATYCLIELVRLLWFKAPDAFTDNYSLRALGEQFLLIQGFTDNDLSWNYPAWSVSIELWINLAFGASALALTRFGRQALPVVLLATTAALGFTVTSSSITLPSALGLALHGAFEFCLGIVVFALYAHLDDRNFNLSGLAEIVIVPILIAAFVYTDTISSTAIGIGLAVVVLLLAFETGPLSWLLLRRPFVLLGTISYSVYLTHSLYLELLNSAVIKLGILFHQNAVILDNGNELLSVGGPWAMDTATLLALTATIFGSALTYSYIEEPMRIRFNRRANHVLLRVALRPADVAIAP